MKPKRKEITNLICWIENYCYLCIKQNNNDMKVVIGEKVEPQKLGDRLIDCQETLGQLRHFGGAWGTGSWGMHNLINCGNRALRMTVQGRLFKGHVYISVNGADLYDVTFCSNRGTIKKVLNDVYFDDLFRLMDYEIETPKPY
jgi:hypothetical protein